MRRLALAPTAIALLIGTTSAVAAGTPFGKYRTTIKGDRALGGALNGTWVIDLTKGAFSVSDDGHPVIQGTDAIHGETITVRSAGGSTTCSTPGKYKFERGGNKLRFTVIHESSSGICIARKDVLTHGAFTRTR